MPRHGRINIAGGIYHVIQRGIERREIFADDADRGEFIRRLGEGILEKGCKCYGWVLMPNHLHLLIRTGKMPLSDLMRKLLTGYAIYFNRRHRRSGYLYQNRYKSILCQEDAYLLELVRYIHLNPLRGKIVKDMEGLGKYNWSGHSVLVGQNKAQWQSTGEILERFSDRRSAAIKKYEEFVEEAKDRGRSDEFTGGGLRRSAGGWEGVMKLRRAKERWQGDERILGDGTFVEGILKESEEAMTRKEKLKKDGWDIEKLVRRVCEIFDITAVDIKRQSKRSKTSDARSLAAYWGKTELGMKGVDMARYFGITSASISSAIRRGQKIADDKKQYLII